MTEDERKTERRRRQVAVIKKLRPDRKGRGALLPGLWAARLAAGVSQAELAERAGIGRGTVRGLERQERRAHATTIRKLCRALRVEPVDLVCVEISED